MATPDGVDLARMRHEYESTGADVAQLGDDPIIAFGGWLAAAVEGRLTEPNAMVVGTVDDQGQPWSRYLLLKAATAAGFDFFTNFEGLKSDQLRVGGRASITFGWLELHRQVNVAGTVEVVPDDEADAYWAQRPRGSQIGGWASDQSRPIADRAALVAKFSASEARFEGVAAVPRPEHWGGWRVVPHTIEFWQGRPNRLHDRIRYTRSGEPGSPWSAARLQP